MKSYHGNRAFARTLIGGGGGICIYLGYAQLTSFEINFISKETSQAEPEYMNIHPPPHQHSSDSPAWKPHISYITNKLSKSIGIICKSSFYLSKSSLRSLYYAMVYPYLHYCNIFWASTYKTNLQRIVRLHKRVIRILNRAKYDAPSKPIFKELKILDFEQIHSLQLGLCMFSFIHSFLPKKYSDMFTFNYQIHAYNTRSLNKLYFPRFKSNIRKFSLQFQGPNSLPPYIFSCFSISSFKSKLKYYLINNDCVSS